MSKQIYLHIPEPCHENWESMSPVQQGRFCQSCSKQVVDFSSMSDKQILDTLAKAAGKTCGRFSPDQLERPVVREIPRLLRPHAIFLSAFIPAFIISGTAAGQQKLQGKVIAKQNIENRQLMGETVTLPEGVVKISGSVSFDEAEPVAGASVLIKGSKTGTVTNDKGQFELRFPSGKQKITLAVSYIGYETQVVEVSQKNLNEVKIRFSEKSIVTMGYLLPVVIDDEFEQVTERPLKKVSVKGKVVNTNGDPVPYATLKINSLKREIAADSSGQFAYTDVTVRRRESLTASSVGYREYTTKIDYRKNNEEIKLILEPAIATGSVVVKCFTTQSLQGALGGLSVVKPVTIRDTATTFIKKFFNNEMFKAYPNPTVKGADINLTFKLPGKYSVQVFDNSGKLYLQKELLIEGAMQKYLISMSETMGAGIYYVKAINTSSNKQFIDKLIIQ